MWTNAHEDRCARKLGFEYSATLNPYPDHIKIIEYKVIYRYCLICFEYSYRSPLPLAWVPLHKQYSHYYSESPYAYLLALLSVP